MGAAFLEPRHHDAARIVVGLLTARPSTPTLAEEVAVGLGADALRPDEVAAGAAILLDRILGDVTAALRLDRAETLEVLGRWVAADEFAGRSHP